MQIYGDAVRRAVGSHYKRPVAMLLALVLLLVWQGVAQADDFIPPDTSQLPDAIHGPGADRVPPGLACPDAMDVSPEDYIPNPGDANSVAWRAEPTRPFAALRNSADDACPQSQSSRKAIEA